MPEPTWAVALSAELAVSTGRFRLRPVDLDADLPLLASWMNDPDVAAFWELAGPNERTRAHVHAQQISAHAEPYIGVMDDVPMSYWEIYRADLDPLAAHYPARAYDAGIHLLLGPADARGRGVGASLIRDVADRLLRADERIERVVAEPDVRNTRSVRAFERAGFTVTAELELPDKRASLVVRDRATAPASAGAAGPAPEPYDLLGVGIGPFNLALAALADDVPDLRAVFFDANAEFSWHPGLLFSDAVLQVPFLADLVTMVDPTSRWSFLNYLRAHERLFPFYFSERFHIPRREYDHYCRWVATGLPSCRFGTTVETVAWDADEQVFRVGYRAGRQHGEVSTRNIVLGLGTEPVVPDALAGLAGDRVFHVADYLDRRAGLLDEPDIADVTVLGSGQSGAEVFLDLLRAQPERGWRLRWLSRSPAFAPMEYSKLGLEHFTPEYTDYFHQLPEPTRDQLFPAQWQLYKAISADTIAAIHDLLYERGVGGGWPDVTLMPNVEVTAAGRARRSSRAGADDGAFELGCRHVEQNREFAVSTDAVVLATGYQPRHPTLLEPMRPFLDLDARGRYRVDACYRVALDPRVLGGLYVQNAETHTHGVGAPDLGLGAYRAAVILNAVTGRTCFRLPRRTAFTTFGLPADTSPAHPPSPTRVAYSEVGADRDF